MTFSDRLRQLRQEKRMTQVSLGQAVDISPRMISFYESGNHFPRDEIILKRIADLFEVSLDYIMRLCVKTNTKTKKKKWVVPLRKHRG